MTLKNFPLKNYFIISQLCLPISNMQLSRIKLIYSMTDMNSPAYTTQTYITLVDGINLGQNNCRRIHHTCKVRVVVKSIFLIFYLQINRDDCAGSIPTVYLFLHGQVRRGISFAYLIHHFLILSNPYMVHRIQGDPPNASEPLQVSFVDILEQEEKHDGEVNDTGFQTADSKHFFRSF